MSATIAAAARLTYGAIGSRITIHPRTEAGTLCIAGTLQWLTLTSDEVTVAVQEAEDEAAQEWALLPTDDVWLREAS